MSNYGSVPPPGPYTPPSASTPGYNGQQSQSSGAPNQGQHAHKSGGGFGQMMNQAVTTGKPMLNKLGKTISSKLGGKPPPGGPPQHLQSYANYQQHYSQGQSQGQQGQQGHQQAYQGQPQQQTYSPQPQQQQWQPPQQQQAQQHQQTPPPPIPGAYAPQPSPYQQQSNYATPISTHSGQSNYFPPAQQPPGPPPGAPPHNPMAVSPGGGMTAPEQQMHTQQGYTGYQGQPQGQHQPQQSQTGQFPGQQTGVVGTGPAAAHAQGNAPAHDVSPIMTPSQIAMPSQWQSTPEQHAGSQHHMPSPVTSHQQPYVAGIHQQSGQPEPDRQQWNPSPNQAHPPSAPPAPLSPPPLQMHSKPPSAPSMPPQPSQSPGPASQHPKPEPSQTEFIAELPADMGNMSLADSKASGPQYQAYSPQPPPSGSPTNRFSVPRRAMSGSSLPLADPWRFADPMTEQPTREFYILADLLFDALDRKFEPHSTGMLEAPKVLRSWIELTQDAYRLFSHNDYNALARMWSIEGIPHVMVPVQPFLSPVWNFNQHSHAQDLKVNSMPNMDHVTYLPALNRAGWYKFFFLEMIAGSDDLGKLLASVCADTYKPGVLNQPDLNKRDKSEIPALHARAAEVQGVAIRRACEEAADSMSSPNNVRPLSTGGNAQHASRVQATPISSQQASAGDMDMLMHEIQMASNDIAVASVAEGQVYRPAPNQSGGYSRLV